MELAFVVCEPDDELLRQTLYSAETDPSLPKHSSSSCLSSRHWSNGYDDKNGVASLDSLQRAFFGLRFKLAFLDKQGNEFQAWFSRLMGHAFPADFVPVRPYGREGDLKCDGRRESTRTIFQCYAARTMKAAALKQKINADFAGARVNWPGEQMTRWIFVHNDGGSLSTMTAKDCQRQL